MSKIGNMFKKEEDGTRRKGGVSCPLAGFPVVFRDNGRQENG